MNKRIRQYVGLITAIVFYYLFHEGAHFLYALITGSFTKINFLGFGIQIGINNEMMSDTQLGIFCILGSLTTLVLGYLLVVSARTITKSSSKVFMACAYYVTIAMLFIDPLYLSILCGFFGGGDMNGISLLLPEMVARISYGVILLFNAFLFWKLVLPKYTEAFHNL